MLEQEYLDMKEAVAKLVDKEITPIASAIDHNGAIPRSLIDLFCGNGYMGIFAPEEYGGSACDTLHYAIMVEEVSRGCASCGTLLAAHNSLVISPILEMGTEAQKKKFLPKLASGEHIGCFCLTEPDAGSDAGSIKAFAKDLGDSYEITGTKNFITNGKEAHIAIIFAKTEKTQNYKGISAFIVDTASSGFQVQKCEDKLGIKGSSTAQIFLDKVTVPKENLLGELGKGFKVAMNTLNGGRISIAAQAVGIGEAAFRYAKKYAKERIQFGRPIADLQAIQFILADMSTRLAAARGLVHESCYRKNAGLDYAKESAQAKLFASETAMWVATKALQVCGGVGYTKEYPVERHFRDAKITEIYEGTSEIQKVIIAASELKD